MQGRKILMIAGIWPEERASGASSRVLDLAAALLQAGAQVTLTADGRENAATAALRKRGIACVRLAPNDDAFDAFVRELQPEAAIFDRYMSEEKFSWRLRAAHPACLRILDTVDLHWLRVARQNAAAVEAGMPELNASELLPLAGDTALREVAAIYRSDLSLITSDAEMDILAKTCGVPAFLLQLCRLSYPEPGAANTFAARRGYAFIGNFRHPPNADAVAWLRTEIWPRLRQLQPDAEIDVWGAYAQAKHLALGAPELGFHLRGFADDQFAVLRQCRVNLAPLRFGAGIKIKIADGWWCSTPTVTTPVGAEGMHGGLDFGGQIASTPAAIAAAAVTLHTDQKAWERAARAGVRIINELYRPANTVAPFIARLSELLANPERVRRRNLTGEILWQQSLRSSEYFSRWIEAKQRAAAPAVP